jgi:hypothetical protein
VIEGRSASIALAAAVFPEPDAPVMMSNGITSSSFQTHKI